MAQIAKRSIPFSGKYNTRISASNPVSSTTAIAGFAVAGIMIAGNQSTPVDKDERWINCFLTKEGSVEYIVKRPGAASLNTPQAGSVGNEILVWTGNSSKIMSCFGAVNSTLYDGTTGKGNITGLAQSISETKVGSSNVATIVMPSSDSTAWYYDAGATVAVATKITDGDFPGNNSFVLAGQFVSIDGFNCIMTTDGKIWASDLNSITAWTSNSFDSNNDYPDTGVGAVRWKDKIICFGSESMQFWYNAGLSPFPLAAVGGSSTIKLGASSAAAITTMSDYVFWCGGTDKGGLTIYQYDGSVTRISTPEQDFQLVLAGTASISLTAMRIYGKSFVLVSTGSTTYVYCLEDKRWHEWIGQANLWQRCVGLSVGNQILTYSISTTSTAGKVFVFNPQSLTFQDNGATITASAQSMEDDSGTNYRKFYSEFRLDADIETSSSVVTLAVSDDDYQTFTTVGSIDLSAPWKLTTLGSSSPENWNRRAWKLTNSSNAPMRIRSADYWVSAGTT